MAKKSEQHELIEGLVAENISLSKTIDGLTEQNADLLRYIIFFHEEMEQVSSRMQEKTDELFGTLLKRIVNKEDCDE